jgi:flagellar motor switch protein FliM
MTDGILSTNELEALRDAVDSDVLPEDAEGASDSSVLADGEGLPRHRFGEGRVVGVRLEERLSYVFDRSARALETRLSDILEVTASANITFLKVTRFSEFKEAFEVDSRELAMMGFQIAGLPGSGLIAIEPELVDRLVEALMGGAKNPDVGGGRRGRRPVTELDLRVLQRMIGSFLDDVGRVWNPAESLEISITSADTTGVVARSYTESSPVVVALLEANVGKRMVGMIGLVLPRGAVDVMADPSSAELRRGKVGFGPGPMAELVPDFEVSVEVQLGTKRISVRDLLALSAGDVFFLEGKKRAVAHVQGVPKLLGVPGSRNGNKALRIAEVLGRN